MGRVSTRRRHLAASMVAVLPGLVMGMSGASAWAAPAQEWRPVDDGVSWGEAVVTPVPDGEVPGCTGDRSAWYSDAGEVTLIVLECPDVPTATGVVLGLGRNLDYSGAPGITPVFGPGYDLALTAANGNLERYWSQGTTYFGIGTGCGFRDCASATARYADELARLAGTELNPLWPEPVTGPIAGFVPSGEPAMLVLDAVLPSAQLRVTDCAEARQREWRTADRGFIQVSVVECGSADLAFRAWSDLWVSATTYPAYGGALGPGIDGAGVWPVDAERIRFGRAWVQGTSYAYVERVCGIEDLNACSQVTAADAVQLSGLVPGEPLPDHRAWNLFGRLALLLFVVPLGTIALLVLGRSAWRFARERGWAVAPAPAGFTVVDGVVRRARWSRWLRTSLAAVIVLGGYLAGALASSWTGNPILFGVWIFLSPLLLVPLVGGLLRLVWRPHQLVRVARGPRGRATPIAAAGAALRLAAGVTAALALLGYIACAVLLLLVTYQTPQMTQATAAGLFATGQPLAIVIGSAMLFVAGLEDRGLTPLLFLAVLLGPMTVAYLLNRLGQRLGQRSLQAVLEADTRPYLLYLRGFEEDDLRITPSLARTSFLQWLSPFGRPRFEEVMVRYLARFGPVIAISGQHGRALPELGAAKASFSDDGWQERVHEWMGQALAVVVAATPDQVRHGLMWELVQLSDVERHARVLLVTAPWPREQLVTRWQGFLAAASSLPLFAPLARLGFPSGVEVMTFTSDAGWRGYGASRRWDWTYAAALVAAVEDAAPTWNRDRQLDQQSAIVPDPLPPPTVSQATQPEPSP